MTAMHLALGALSSIFGAHLSWAITDWIMKRRRDGRPVFWLAVLSVTAIAVLVAGVGVVMSNTGVA